jgi:hypothetical protein
MGVFTKTEVVNLTGGDNLNFNRISKFSLNLFRVLSAVYGLSQKCLQPPHRKQAYNDSKTESKMTKINVLVAHIKFSISPIPEARP